MRVYLDACALNRLFDDRSQARVRAESEAVEDILTLCFQNQVLWLASEVLEAEIWNNPNSNSRIEALKLISLSTTLVIATDALRGRAESLQTLGYGAYDALHLACAEAADADCFLTTDDRLIRRARRGLGKLSVKVQNPVDWIKEHGL